MKILSNINYSTPSFKRYFQNEEEKLKQFELNRNKSIDYLGIDKKFVEYLYETRVKGIRKNIPEDIKRNFSEINYEADGSLTQYDTFNYPVLYRGIGKER